MTRNTITPFRALIIDDEMDIRELLEITLQRMGGKTSSAATVIEGITMLDSEQFDVCLTDMRMPDGSGMDILNHIQEHHPELPVAVITAYGNVEDAVSSLKAGAFDFISKPVNLSTLHGLIEKAITLPKVRPDVEHSPQLTGNSPSIQNLRTLIDKLARSQAPVYINGESGTGKELVARQIHAQGSRASQPFVPVNCGAIPTELMESELFGHVKGSFTGAVSDNPGLFRGAHGGTLFLDEVADLPLHMQVKLLRAIQERKIRPVGGHSEESIDVRILCATHKPLAALVEKGEFRQDLYYRLNVIQVDVPALRERKEDIPLLCETILSRVAPTENIRLQADAVRALKNYDFPGNIRELENILERAVTLAEGQVITESDLLLDQHRPAAILPKEGKDDNAPMEKESNKPLKDSMQEIEKSRIVKALEANRYNITKTAETLGMTFRQLRYRINKLGIK